MATTPTRNSRPDELPGEQAPRPIRALSPAPGGAILRRLARRRGPITVLRETTAGDPLAVAR